MLLPCLIYQENFSQLQLWPFLYEPLFQFDLLIQPVQVAVMAAILIPRTTIEKVGLLDERFFLYYEDIEYCARLKKSKLLIYYLLDAKIKHVHGASGKFASHLCSPLAKSAQIYYGKTYSQILNSVLWLGQKYQLVLSKFFYRS